MPKTQEQTNEYVFQPDYSLEEEEYLNLVKENLEKAKHQRDKEHKELDGQTYLQYYKTNARAANSYIPPKTHKQDTRIVTGTTEEKEQTLLSGLLNYNFQPNIQAFDKENNQKVGWGETAEDMIKKSREIETPENYEYKRMLFYKEALDQGTSFVEERWDEKQKSIKKLKQDIDWSEGIDPNKVDWSEKLENVQGECTTHLLSGTKVYAGNIREFFMQKQPFVFTVDIIPYSQAEQIFGNWARWEYVSRDVQKTDESSEIEYRNWSLLEHQQDTVEIIKYQNKPANEFQILCNGVMMLPVGFPLTAISPSGRYTIAKLDINPISKFFFYSKSIPAKTKVMQATLDEFLKLMVLKTQQSFKPPLANSGRHILSDNVFQPGQITRMKPGKLEPIADHIGKGVTQSEFNTFELINGLMNERSVSDVYEGQPSPGKQTATEIRELKKQSIKKIASSIVGVIKFEKQLSYLRLYNILDNWTKPIDQRIDETKDKMVDVYRKYSVDTSFETGEEGERLIEFTTQQTPTSQQIKAEEDILSLSKGKNIRKTYLNVNEVRNALKNLKFHWFIDIEPTEKHSDQLDRELWIRDLQVLQALEQMQKLSLNWDYIKDQLAHSMKKDPDKLFLQAPEQPQRGLMGGGGVEQGGQGQDVGKQLVGQAKSQTPQMPSVNTMAQA